MRGLPTDGASSLRYYAFAKGIADGLFETTGGFGHCLIERSLMQA
jgi:hypothetical protein